AMEAKERVRIKSENQTLATITLQNYFRMYDKLAGMTGTAETEASEFGNTYNLPVVPIPTHRPMVRDDMGDLIYKSELAKFYAVIDDVMERHDKGQPILIGTASVEKSEVLSRMLEKRGIEHEVLNAKHHTREAQIVVQAGRLHGVTVATNMAGRGVDILLGGNPEGLARQETIAQGLDPDGEEGAARLTELLPKFSEECKAEGDKIRELGGLYVLGSERHESRRIDNQLRGRSGRQGDPGQTRFFLSLEDELMRLFATGAMSWVMNKALPDDVPIEARMVTKAIERAQNTVEARNAEIRKDVLKYDEVMNEQRKVIYARRMQILDGEDLRERTREILAAAIDGLVQGYMGSEYEDEWDIDGLLTEVRLYYPSRFTLAELGEATSSELVHESLLAEALAYHDERERDIPGGSDTMRDLERQLMLQIIDTKWREHLAEMDYLREGINLRAMGQQDPLVAWQREGYDMFGQMIAGIDDDYVRYVMHVEVLAEQPVEPDFDQAEYVAPDGPVHDLATTSLAAPAAGEGAFDDTDGSVAQDPAMTEVTQAPIVKAPEEKLGRNQPCFCGSGKKFKLCHGR
ncbi:MAG: SEC-C metal-binding domain-containing protein, partial [Acidimicrobiales bacterium]